MKRLWAACAVLLLLFSAALTNTHYLKGFTADLAGLLEQAEPKAGDGGWEAADALTRLARQKWDSRDAYLHIVLRHGDIEAVNEGFREVQELIRHREPGEYAAANARLISRIRRLYEEEQLTLKNIL